jgi:hypothetical protein
MNGKGLLLRDPGKLPPSARKQLEKVGDEKITKIVAVRTPLTSTTKAFLNIISLGQFEKISKKYFDDLFHLAFWINDKYNLEKNEVISFGTKNPIKSNSQTKTISVGKDITFNELMEKTRRYMGDNNFTAYDAQTTNCQNFLNSILTANGIGSAEDKAWIKQDTDKVFKEVPTFAKVLGNLATTAGAAVNRLIEGEGRPRRLFMTDDGRYFYMSKGKRKFVKVPAGISQKQVVKINIGELVKPKKKRKKRKTKAKVLPGVSSGVSRLGLPPPVLIKEAPGPPKRDETAKVLEAVNNLVRFIPREPTRIPEPEPLNREELARARVRALVPEDDNDLLEESRRLRAEITNTIPRFPRYVGIDPETRELLDEVDEVLNPRPTLPSTPPSPQNNFSFGSSPRMIGTPLNFGSTPFGTMESISSVPFGTMESISSVPFGSIEEVKPKKKSGFDIRNLFGKGPEDVPVDDGSFMIRPTCYNPLSIGYSSMPIGIEAGNPNVKTGALTGTVQPTAPKPESKDEPQKPDVPQKGQGIVGDVINLFNPSATTTTRILGLGFGMAGGCNGITNSQCGCGDPYKEFKERFDKTPEGIKMKERMDALAKETEIFRKEQAEKKRIADEKRKAVEAELDRKLNRPLEWYEKAGKFLTGKVAGTVPVIGPVAGLIVGQETECAMRNLNKEECRIFRERQRGKGDDVDGLYNDEIEKITDKIGIKVPVIAADEMDEIVRMVGPNTKDFGFIINTNPSSSDGSGNDGYRPGHWMAVYIDNDEDRPSVEFFDPLADPMDSKMIDGIKKIVDKIDNEKYFLFKENMVKHQSDDSNTCGHHAIHFLENRFGGMSWPEASGFVKCMNQANEKEKQIMSKVKKYENYL